MNTNTRTIVCALKTQVPLDWLHVAPIIFKTELQGLPRQTPAFASSPCASGDIHVILFPTPGEQEQQITVIIHRSCDTYPYSHTYPLTTPSRLTPLSLHEALAIGTALSCSKLNRIHCYRLPPHAASKHPSALSACPSPQGQETLSTKPP